MQIVEIKANKRENFGKMNNKSLRSEGKVPGVIYSKKGVHHFSTTPKELKPLLYTPDYKQANVEIDGTVYSCVVQAAQFHPVTDNLVHIDLLQLVDGNPIRIEVPIRFEGVSPGVKAGGVFSQTMRAVKIKCLPKDIVDQLIIDISSTELGDVVRVSDINLPEGIELMSMAATPVASVNVPRALKADDEVVAVVADGEEEKAAEGAEASE